MKCGKLTIVSTNIGIYSSLVSGLKEVLSTNFTNWEEHCTLFKFTCFSYSYSYTEGKGCLTAI